MNKSVKLFFTLLFLICISLDGPHEVFAQEKSSNSGTEISFTQDNSNIKPGGVPTNIEVGQMRDHINWMDSGFTLEVHGLDLVL